ncbi:hypothetical protein [Amycolatopsis sp. NPDC051128]|uniref:hypothetical protein n=1 Tax=Amycolatopsis sp. NPDC051128 TaxID=3155412 RepID=UPI003415EB2A
MTTTEKPLHVQRAEALRAQAAGILRLADMVEANPELPAEYLKPSKKITVTAWYASSPAQLAAIARAGMAHGAKVDKDIVGEDIYRLRLSWGWFTAEALAQRGEVCERVVTGIETVTKTVRDPAALAAVPTVEVTETVENVEWVCRPLLAAESAKDGAE